MKDELREIISSVRTFFESERNWGLTEYFITDVQRPHLRHADKLQQLDELKNRVMVCRGCDLCKTRRKVVFGEGNTNAQLMFVGEAPGMEEDLQGRPFVGRAGELLNKIIDAMGLSREDVYIANCLKCRPPQNRSPLPAELITCKPYLEEQMRLIKPKVICGLGRFAAASLLKTEKPISALRGKFHECEGIKFMPTFHPAYLLRNPADKKLCWQDIKKVMSELGLKK